MKGEVARTTLAVLSIGGLIAASFWIMRPFLVALIWATIASGVRRFGRRLAGARGEQVIRLAGQAIRGVALAVLVAYARREAVTKAVG